MMNDAMDDRDGLLRKATALHRRGDLSAAQDCYRQVLQLQPNHTGARHYLGVIAYQRGQFNQAVELIGNAITLDPCQPIFYNNLGLALRALGRRDEAEACYVRALQLRPEYPDALSNLGVLFTDRGEVEQALQCYEQALQLQPQHVDALYNSGSSSYDVFSFNQPLVTLPGRFNIGRYTLACYRKMGISDLIAASRHEYVQLATRVATDGDFRHFVKSQLAERTDVLFEDQGAVEEHVRFFREAAG